MSFFFRFLILLIVLCWTVLQARVVHVSSAAAFKSACQNAQPGDTILVADGIYNTGSSVTMTAVATEQNPILISAENIGSAELTGDSYFDLRKCAFITIRGFVLTSTDKTVIKLQASHHIRITRNQFQLQETSSLKWLIVQGMWNDPNTISHHNTIEYNLFENKHKPGNFITIDGTPDPTYLSSQHDVIRRNHFRNIGPRVQNEMEAVRVGWSEMSMSSGFTVIEENLFEDCDGDPEIISVKTCYDTLRHNTFIRSQGTLSLRHGNGSVVNGNFFFGEGKAGTGGIRLYGNDHVIMNNYFEGLTGTKWDAPLTLTNGDYDGGSSLSRHFRINRAKVVNNTLVDNTHHIEIGFTNNGNYTKPPRDVLMAGNLIVGSQNELVKMYTAPQNMTWSKNMMHTTDSAVIGMSYSEGQIIEADPLLEQVDGLWKLMAQSPAIDSAGTPLPMLTIDMDGQPRDSLADIGADEYSPAAVRYGPLTAADVGPFAGGTTAIESGAFDPLPVQLQLNCFPNPFNATVTLQVQAAHAGTLKLGIFDLNGRRVYSSAKRFTAAASGQFKWQADNYASGLYIVQVESAGRTIRRKIMLIK